jgi:predicted acyl esterase
MDVIIGTGNISKRRYGIKAERSLSVPLRDNAEIDVDVFRPNDEATDALNLVWSTGKKAPVRC